MLWNEVTACPPLTSLFFLTHPRAHKHTHRHKPCVLSAVSLSSHILHGAFPYMQPHTGTLWADPAPDLVCFWVVIPLWGLCLRPALAPTGEKMLVVRTGPGRGLSQRGGAGRYQKAQDLVASDQRSCLFINWVPKAIVFDSHNRSFLFSCLTWGIMQVTQFFPSDFGSFQDIKKDVDICVFLGLMPPVMIEEFVWFLSFCWHYQQLLPLFYDTSGRQQWLCQTVSYFRGKADEPLEQTMKASGSYLLWDDFLGALKALRLHAAGRCFLSMFTEEDISWSFLTLKSLTLGVLLSNPCGARCNSC